MNVRYNAATRHGNTTDHPRLRDAGFRSSLSESVRNISADTYPARSISSPATQRPTIGGLHWSKQPELRQRSAAPIPILRGNAEFNAPCGRLTSRPPTSI
jgi:hypothetical protein